MVKGLECVCLIRHANMHVFQHRKGQRFQKDHPFFNFPIDRLPNSDITNLNSICLRFPNSIVVDKIARRANGRRSLYVS